MSVEARALSAKRICEESPVVRLLRADNAPIVLAVLGEIFPHGSVQVPASTTYEYMAGAFDVLRNAGFTIRRTPAEYAAEWIKAGWLIRRAGSPSTGETLEPTREGLQALQLVEQVDAGRSTVTASRIQSITTALAQLDRETDPDIETRRASLLRQREAIDRQLEQLDSNVVDVLPQSAARERVQDILNQAAGIPADFARVRQELERLNLDLCRSLLDSDGGRGTVLEQIFEGVDLISQSEAGRSFNGFFEVLVDNETIAYVEHYIDNVAKRVAAELSDQERERFVTLLTTFESEAYSVNSAITSLARNLRHYVASEQFAEDRRLIELIRTARKYASEAVEAADLKAFQKMATPLMRMGMEVRSVGALQLRNPGAEVVEEPLVEYSSGSETLEGLLEAVRESEIDFAELESCVAEVLEEQPEASIADMLERHPATQGLASVVGLIILVRKAAHHAEMEELGEVGMHGGVGEKNTETVSWDEEGTTRRAVIPRLVFVRERRGDERE